MYEVLYDSFEVTVEFEGTKEECETFVTEHANEYEATKCLSVWKK